MAKKLTKEQKEGLAKGRKLMKEAIAWQKEGGFTTVTVKKYKRNIKTYLKKHAGK